MAVTVKFDMKNLRTFQGVMGGAIARAMNRSAISARAVGAKSISEDLGLRVGTVRDAIVLEKATATKSVATLTVRGRRIPLIEFRARGPEPSRGRGKGVSYLLGRGKRRRLSSAFIATMRSGHRGVFKRFGKGRLPIIELLGPSLVLAFTRRTVVEPMRARYLEAMRTNLQHEVEFEVQRLARSIR